MKRGFTLIELLVVIAVISILTGLTLMSYTTYQNRADDSQAQSIANAVRAGAERYYAANNEYPLASIVFGGTPTGSPPASYTSALSTLGIGENIVKGDYAKLVPCAGTVCTFGVNDQSDVYYLTKDAADGTAQRQYTIGGCTYTFPTTEDGAMSYIIMYYSRQVGQWRVSKSSRGMPTTSDTFWCPFTAF